MKIFIPKSKNLPVGEFVLYIAGPIIGSEQIGGMYWQNKVLEILLRGGYNGNVAIPLRKDEIHPKFHQFIVENHEEYKRQLYWEMDMMEQSSILFWFQPKGLWCPKDKDYAATTRIEFGKFMNNPQTIVGMSPRFNEADIIMEYCLNNGYPVYISIEDTLQKFLKRWRESK